MSRKGEERFGTSEELVDKKESVENFCYKVELGELLVVS